MRDLAIRLLVVLVAGALSAACDNGESPTAPSPNPTETQTFTGTLTRNGSQIHSFAATATTGGEVTATITAINPPTSPAFGFSMGTWDGTVCTAVLTNNVATAASELQGRVVGLSSLCVRLFDPFGNLAADQTINYTVTVEYPVNP